MKRAAFIIAAAAGAAIVMWLFAGSCSGFKGPTVRIGNVVIGGCEK